MTTLTMHETTGAVAYPRSPQIHSEQQPSRTRALDACAFCGPFSLIDDYPLAVTTVPGMRVRVNKGALWMTNPGTDEGAFVEAGGYYRCDRVGVLLLGPARRAELTITLP